MIAVYLFPLYVLVNLYVFRWGIRYMSACSRHFKKKWIRIFIGSADIWPAFPYED